MIMGDLRFGLILESRCVLGIGTTSRAMALAAVTNR